MSKAYEHELRRREREHSLKQIAFVMAAGGEITVHPEHLLNAHDMTLYSSKNPDDGSVTFKVERSPR